MTQPDTKHIVTAANAEKIWSWFQERGGIAVWPSVNLSNPGASWTTPLNDAEGKPTTKPTWQAANEPRAITDPAEVTVSLDTEVKRFHVAVRRGSQGFSLKLTDTSSQRVRNAEAKAGEGSYHVFDYETQEAIIMRPTKQFPLNEWIKNKPEAK